MALYAYFVKETAWNLGIRRVGENNQGICEPVNIIIIILTDASQDVIAIGMPEKGDAGVN